MTDAFEWDETKRQTNLEKHGIDFAVVIAVWRGDTLEIPDRRREYGENRFIVLGAVDGAVHVVVYTPRDGARRLISARKAHEHERRAYRAAFPERFA